MLPLDLRRITSSPAALAQWATKGAWRAHSHLVFLNRLLTDLAAGRLTTQVEGVAVPTKRLFVSMPPQHGKSELISRWFPAWYLGKRPRGRIIHTSYGDKYSQSWGRRARSAMRQCGPLFGVQVSDEKSEMREWEIREHAGSMISAGVRGEITGRPADVLIVDDPHKNAEEATSEAEQEKCWDMFQTGPLTRFSEDGVFAGLATRWHNRDLFGRLMERWDSEALPYRYVNLAAIAEYDDELGRAEGEPLCPELKSLAFLEGQRKTLSPYWWNALYQGRPTQHERAEFLDEWFGDHIWFDQWPERRGLRCMALDPSKGRDAKKGDYQAYVSAEFDHDGNVYVDADLERRPVPKMVSDGVQLYRRFEPDGFVIEGNAWQDLLVGPFVQGFSDAGMLEYSPYTVVNKTKKEVRILRLSSLLAEGRLRFKRGSKGAAMLVSQLREFPMGAHDDGPDALEMAIALAQKIRRQDAETEDEYESAR